MSSQAGLRNSKPYIYINTWFLIVLGVLLFKGGTIALCAIIAAILHECGHIALLYINKGRITRVNAGIKGIQLISTGMQTKSTWKNALIILAGCAVNAILAVCFMFCSDIRLYVFSCANAILCLINLLPHSSFDGGRLLSLLTEGHRNAERICKTADITVLLIVLSAGIAVFYYSKYNPTALLLGLCLISKLPKARRKISKKS